MRRGVVIGALLSIALSIGIIFRINEVRNIQYQSAVRSFLDLDTPGQIAALRERIHMGGASRAWQYLKDVYIEDGVLRHSNGEPHVVAHIVGEQFYRDGGAAGITSCDTTFTYACFHGFVDMWVTDKGPEVIPDVMRACPTDARIGCSQGIGRGLLTYDGDAALAFTHCEKYLKGSERYICVEGIFTRYKTNAYVDHSKPMWDICSELPVAFRSKCTSIAFSGVRGKYDSTQKAEAFCSNAVSSPLRIGCVQSIGSYVARIIARGDAGRIEEQCNQMVSQQDQNECFISAAKQLMSMRTDEWSSAVSNVCAHVPASLRVACADGTLISDAAYDEY